MQVCHISLWKYRWKRTWFILYTVILVLLFLPTYGNASCTQGAFVNTNLFIDSGKQLPNTPNQIMGVFYLVVRRQLITYTVVERWLTITAIHTRISCIPFIYKLEMVMISFVKLNMTFCVYVQYNGHTYLLIVCILGVQNFLLLWQSLVVSLTFKFNSYYFVFV